MRKVRSIIAVVFVAPALVALPAGSAEAHVHGITPLRCTQAPANAGANQTNDTPAAAANGGPISGVIPVSMGGAVPLSGGGFNAAVCDGATQVPE